MLLSEVCSIDSNENKMNCAFQETKSTNRLINIQSFEVIHTTESKTSNHLDLKWFPVHKHTTAKKKNGVVRLDPSVCPTQFRQNSHFRLFFHRKSSPKPPSTTSGIPNSRILSSCLVINAIRSSCVALGPEFSCLVWFSCKITHKNSIFLYAQRHVEWNFSIQNTYLGLWFVGHHGPWCHEGRIQSRCLCGTAGCGEALAKGGGGGRNAEG